MRKIINPPIKEFSKLTQRPGIAGHKLDAVVGQVFEEVERRGDSALIEFTKKFDDVDLSTLQLNLQDLEQSVNEIDPTLKNAIDLAFKNIYTFHKQQKSDVITVQTMDGITCWQKPVAIENVGLYIPGGTAPLFSSILMLAIPALIAGCKRIVLTTPPTKKGTLPVAMRYAAYKCGISEFYTIGGAQAIAALSLGTETIAKVDKIFGPGNQYVTAAKMFAFARGTAIDMPAGPSEVLVYADDTGHPEFIASDLLSQAEHGVDSQVILVTTHEEMIERVEKAVNLQLMDLPRKELAAAALSKSLLICLENDDDAFNYINQYAPEHLIIASEYPDKYLDRIVNAGSVFVGNFSPESAGDYASGTNHTLPTAGAARSFSGVNVDAYVKKITFQRLTESGLSNLSDTITTLARTEQLEAHARAVEIRMKS
jgi:histidinol dehydrogenase